MTDLFLSLVPFTPIGIYFMWYRAAANIVNKEQRFQAIATVRQRISADGYSCKLESLRRSYSISPSQVGCGSSSLLNRYRSLQQGFITMELENCKMVSRCSKYTSGSKNTGVSIL